MTPCVPVNGNTRYAGNQHRKAWIARHGPIPAGFIICHKCDNNMCRNEEHLYLGTYSDNMRDAIERGRTRVGDTGKINRDKTHCPQGHEYTPENTYLQHKRKTISRSCKECRRGVNRSYLGQGSQTNETEPNVSL